MNRFKSLTFLERCGLLIYFISKYECLGNMEDVRIAIENETFIYLVSDEFTKRPGIMISSFNYESAIEYVSSSVIDDFSACSYKDQIAFVSKFFNKCGYVEYLLYCHMCYVCTLTEDMDSPMERDYYELCCVTGCRSEYCDKCYALWDDKMCHKHATLFGHLYEKLKL
jgi:hypothetical protein